MKSVIVIGAGHIGAVIAEELSVTRNYQVTLTDLDGSLLAWLNSVCPAWILCNSMSKT